MDFFEVIQLLRRRWPVIVLTVLTGLAAGYVTAPGEGSRDVKYAATVTLLANPQSQTGVNLEQAALLATTGSVPQAVAESLDLASADAARQGVVATADIDTSSIEISATRGDREAAEQASSSFAQELIETLSGSDLTAYNEQVEAATEQITNRQNVVDFQRLALIDNPDDEVIQSDFAAAQQQLTSAQTVLQELQAPGAPKSSLLVVEEGKARRVDPEGVRAPDGKLQRATLLGVFGLLLGVGAAFALDQLDTKIRNKATAEAAFGYPVIAEIPPLPNGKKHKDELLALTHPSAPFVEAYRGLRTVVALTAQPSTNGHGADKHGTVLLVTSPGAGEGKTTTAAHLAAMLAEVGRSVLVVSGDLRRPRLHVLFDVDREPGLTEMLANDGAAPDLRDLVKETKISRVRILPSGAPNENPAPLLRQAGEILQAARKVFDFVIVDTAPILVANDATELATVADGVIVLARATRTSIDAAQRSAEILDRLDTPVMGAVLVGATDTPTAYSYYRYRYYSEADQKLSRRKRRSEARDAKTEGEARDVDLADSPRR